MLSKKNLRRDGHRKKVQNRYMCCWLQPELLRVHLQIQYLSEVTNKPPGDIGCHNPAKSKTKTEKRDAKKDADDPLANILEWLTRVWRSSAQMTRNSPPRCKSRNARLAATRFASCKLFLVEFHSRGNYSRELSVEPTLWSKHQMCASQKFACIVLATFLRLLLDSQWTQLVGVAHCTQPGWRRLFGTDCFAEQFRKSKKSRACFFYDFFAQEFWLGCRRNHRFLDAESWSRSVSLEAAVYLETKCASCHSGRLGVERAICCFVHSFDWWKIFSGMKACLCSDKYILQFSWTQSIVFRITDS